MNSVRIHNVSLSFSHNSNPDQIGPEPTWLLPAPHNDASGRSGGGASLLTDRAQLENDITAHECVLVGRAIPTSQ